MPYLIALFRNAEQLKALALDDALHCGVCQPRADPISVDFLQ
jgi:hypothetical protein